MITARNYAAQAERGLRDLVNNITKSKFRDEYRGATDKVIEMVEGIARSVHFALPDNGVIFNDGFKGLIGTEARLPYPEITIEWFVKASDSDKSLARAKGLDTSSKILVYAKEEDYGIVVSSAFFSDGSKRWEPTDVGIVIPHNWDITCIGDGGYTGACFLLFPNKLDDGSSNLDVNSPAYKMAVRDIGDDAASVLELIEALTCKNISTEPLERIDQSKNARRIKDGKLPLYETKILTVDTNYRKDSKHTGITHDDRTSVRQHLRRGHIRRHPTAGNIWVNACVVGYSELGVIDKQYAVM